jgi:glycosyltransferase involved in cell wall biosynthesis
MMRVAFLVAELGHSGGMAVVRHYARHLIEHERASCELVVCAAKPGPLPETDSGIPVRTLESAAAARVDVAVATWWTTAEALFELDAAVRVAFLQNLEHRFYREGEQPDRSGALGVLDLPVDFIVISSHIQAVLARLRPDARCHLVPVGIDKQVFTPGPVTPREPGPLRVLVEGQPTLWFKGMADAVAAVRAMREPVSLTLCVHDQEAARRAGLAADRIEAGLSSERMAELYREHDVLLKPPRFEGLSLPPLEAFHVGLPCVLTPFTGSEDFACHGVNALVVGFDDVPGTSSALDLLARDEALRARLRDGALRTAERWPDQVASSEAFVTALRELATAPAPPAAAAVRRMLRGRRLTIELSRERLRREEVRISHLDAAAQSYLNELEKTRALAEHRLEMIYELTGRPSYRAARFAKKLARRKDLW